MQETIIYHDGVICCRLNETFIMVCDKFFSLSFYLVKITNHFLIEIETMLLFSDPLLAR